MIHSVTGLCCCDLLFHMDLLHHVPHFLNEDKQIQLPEQCVCGVTPTWHMFKILEL